MSRLERIIKIDQAIRRDRFPSPDSLAVELDVSRRMIFLDRQYMMDRLHAPIAFNRQKGGWYYSEPNYVLPSAMISEGELLAFFLSVEVAQRYMGTAFENPLRSALEKIVQGLEAPTVVSLHSLHRHFTFAPPAVAAVNNEALVALQNAITSQCAVQMRYYTASRREGSDRLVHPHHLLLHNGEWYLHAFDRHRNAIRTFNVARMESWKVLDERFEREADFDPQAWQLAAFGAEIQQNVTSIAIHFSPTEAVYIRERSWHETQVIEDLPDGGLILRLHTSGLGAVKRWVMGYGAHAEVLEPVTLREEIAQEIEMMNKIYGEAEHE